MRVLKQQQKRCCALLCGVVIIQRLASVCIKSGCFVAVVLFFNSGPPVLMTLGPRGVGPIIGAAGHATAADSLAPAPAASCDLLEFMSTRGRDSSPVDSAWMEGLWA